MIGIDNARYQQVLGNELREVRHRLGWTRKELQSRLVGHEPSVQTLATYELGTRQCSLVRFVELCVALGESPSVLLARVHRRMVPDAGLGVRVSLARIAQTAPPELGPLRRWARIRLTGPSVPADAKETIDPAALESIAELCGLPAADMAATLRRLADPGERAG